jgi:RecA-family ATPase
MTARPAAAMDDFPPAPPPADRPRGVVEPLCDPVEIRFGRFLATEPAERAGLIAGLLPLDVVGLLASMGGAGKSMLLYQLAIAVAVGARWLGMLVEHVGGVLYLAAEDDEGELHRRGRRLLEHYETMGHVDRGALSERLHIMSRVAQDSMLTRASDGEVYRTNFLDRVIVTAQRIPDLRLILIDPTSRFRGGSANAEEDTTRYVEALESVRDATGATVLASVHVSKASIREGGDGDQSIVRGSTALVDGVRWVATMQRLRRDAAADYGVAGDEADRYVRLDLAKSNYTRPWPGMWLRREGGGVLVPADLERKTDVRRTARIEEKYDGILERLTQLLQEVGPLTQSRVEREYAGATGRLGAGKDAVRASIGRALHEGSLLAEPDPAGRGGQLLSVPR